MTKTVGCPVWLDGAPVPVTTTPPLLGQSADGAPASAVALTGATP